MRETGKEKRKNGGRKREKRREVSKGGKDVYERREGKEEEDNEDVEIKGRKL